MIVTFREFDSQTKTISLIILFFKNFKFSQQFSTKALISGSIFVFTPVSSIRA